MSLRHVSLQQLHSDAVGLLPVFTGFLDSSVFNVMGDSVFRKSLIYKGGLWHQLQHRMPVCYFLFPRHPRQWKIALPVFTFPSEKQLEKTPLTPSHIQWLAKTTDSSLKWKRLLLCARRNPDRAQQKTIASLSKFVSVCLCLWTLLYSTTISLTWAERVS